MRTEIQAIGAGGGSNLPALAYQSEFLNHSVGLELFTKLREFISATWGIDARTSILCANEAVLSIEARVCHRQCQGGLGICRSSPTPFRITPGRWPASSHLSTGQPTIDRTLNGWSAQRAIARFFQGIWFDDFICQEYPRMPSWRLRCPTVAPTQWWAFGVWICGKNCAMRW